MCGIVGSVSCRNVTELLINGLKKLEYRGYDSAGVAILDSDNIINEHKKLGKVAILAETLQKNPLFGKTGIAHTRWATHGIPSASNAHPHLSGEEIAIVHNGIIENYQEIRDELSQYDYYFNSETDTEVVAHLLHQNFSNSYDDLDAIIKTCSQLNGAYSLGILNKKNPNQLIAVRSGSPLVIGLGIDENFIASDPLALNNVANKFIYLADGEIALINADKVIIYNQFKQEITPIIHDNDFEHENIDKGQYRHYMLKEIMEQPKVIRQTLTNRIYDNKILPDSLGILAQNTLAKIQAIQIVACGTSYHAGLVAKYWIEELTNLPCNVEIASEYRYRKFAVMPNSLFVTISQSGETADTLAALRKAKEFAYLDYLAICNIGTSTLVRESNHAFLTHAGTEIGVASTKAFVAQVISLLLVTLMLTPDSYLKTEITENLTTLSAKIAETLKLEQKIVKLAQNFINYNSALFLGRGINYPIALEGALKLKELSYIHAEAYPAGELKHGPLALVDENMPIVVVAPNDDLLIKLQSNLQEVKARGGKLFVFTEQDTKLSADENIHIIKLPKINKYLAPILYTIPLQLLAYHIALTKGTDVDQPRNLAKSVTVE